MPCGKRTQDRAFTGVTEAPLAKIRALRMEAPNLKYDGCAVGEDWDRLDVKKGGGGPRKAKPQGGDAF